MTRFDEILRQARERNLALPRPPPPEKPLRQTASIAVERRERTLTSVPERYHWASLDASELASRVKPSTVIARARMALQSTSGCILQGRSGSGKTSLAVAILVAANRIGYFTTSFDLAKARFEHQLGDGEAHAIERAVGAPLLLIDELGAEDVRGSAVAEVIHARHNHQRPTIYTTGFEREQLRNRYGDGVVRRVFEGATVIRLGGAG